MTAIRLVTSIPPAMSRLNASGDDIGEIYQNECVSSWHKAGFEPVSVNSKAEDTKEAVHTIFVPRDAAALTGRHHVYFGDLLRTARSLALGGPVGIVNADIVFPPRTDLADKVRGLRPGQVIFCRRLDSEPSGQVTAAPYRNGFDFFGVHTDDLTSLFDTRLVFGAPWWDHYLPIALYMRGCRLRQIEPSVSHLEHAERWNDSLWELFGWRFLAEIKAASTDKSYRSQLKKAHEDPNSGRRSRWKVRVATTLHVNRAESDPRTLHRVSDLNISFIDQVSLPTDQALTELEGEHAHSA